MEILYLLMPIAIALLALIVALFFWAVKSGQFEDLDSPAWRILMDGGPPPGNGEKSGPATGALEEPRRGQSRRP